MAVTSHKPVRLATENGRRIGRLSKAKRQAALPAMEAARLRRSIAMIREEAEKITKRGEEAKKVLEKAFFVAGGDDRLVARALAREALIECSHAMGAYMVLRYCEMAEEGTLCA
ncbi:hypothetical protein ACFQE0_21550 [Methylobacterium komagatae]|uniref:Uncharacterized protein n=1 Tax=Methylobacterium komagatae TaxID=374425 RepID=A0ABW2BP77_9HYPH